MILNWFGQSKKRKQAAEALFQIALVQSRRSDFYQTFGVADTMDGRFDLLSLHVIVIMERLKDFGQDGGQLSQELFDVMFKRMELDLREMGIGDLGVPKHMDRMMKAFNGRRSVYEVSFKDFHTLGSMLARNIYRGTLALSDTEVADLAAYIQESQRQLVLLSLEDLKAGRLVFPRLGFVKEAHDAA